MIWKLKSGVVVASLLATTILVVQTGCSQPQPSNLESYTELREIERQFDAENRLFDRRLPHGFIYPESMDGDDVVDFQKQFADGGAVSVQDGYFYTQKIIYWNCAWIERAVETESTDSPRAQRAFKKALEVEKIDDPKFGLDNTEELVDEVIRPISKGRTKSAREYVQSCGLIKQANEDSR